MSGQYANKEYITTDLLEVAFLRFKGFKFSVDKSNPRRVAFLFQNYDGIIESLVSEFWAGSKELQLLNTFREAKKIAVFDGYQKNFYKKQNNEG